MTNNIRNPGVQALARRIGQSCRLVVQLLGKANVSTGCFPVGGNPFLSAHIKKDLQGSFPFAAQSLDIG